MAFLQARRQNQNFGHVGRRSTRLSIGCFVAILLALSFRFPIFVSTGRVLVKKRNDYDAYPANKAALTGLQKSLETLQESSFRYFVYDHPNMTRMDLRNKSKAGNWTWPPQKWGQRLKDYALWEIRYLEALERHEFRTHIASEADFILIPIPFCAIVTASSQKTLDMRTALETLYNDNIFKNREDKHVFFTFAEFMFDHGQPKMMFSANDYAKFRQVTVAGVVDIPIWERIPHVTKRNGYWGTSRPHPEKKRRKKQVHGHALPNHSWSIQFMGAATDPELKRVHLSKQVFYNKTNYFFYHTTRDTSLNNSTQFRHAPTQPQVIAELLQPSSVGFDIPPEEWLKQFRDSKFCLVIRGDNPGSRSMMRAVKSGCIPVVVSDAMRYWAPVFRSLIAMEDYAVMVDEFDFLRNPAKALNEAVTNLTKHEIEHKIAGINFLQRLILPDEPESLFVQAFGHETLASQTPEYYNVSVQLYGQQHNVSSSF